MALVFQLIFLGIQLAGCGGGEAQWERKYMANEAMFTATMHATPDELIFEYTITNTSQFGLFVVDVSVNVTAQGAAVEEGKPRIKLTPTREVVLLNRLRQVDRRRNYAVPPMAYATLLKPGTTRSISGSLPFPLIPANLPPSQEVHEILTERVAIIVGVVPVPAVHGANEQEVGGVKLWRLPMEAWRQQRELRVEAVIPNLRVLVNQ